MLKIQVALRAVGDSTDLIGVMAGTHEKIVTDLRRGGVTVGISEEGTPISVRVRDVQNMDSIKVIVERFNHSRHLESAEINQLGKLCNQYMTSLAAAYREKYAVVELAGECGI